MDKLDILLAGAIVATFAAYALPVDAETYVQGDHWVMHEHNQWTMQRGGWSRDSDGGGMGNGMGDHMDGRSNGPRR